MQSNNWKDLEKKVNDYLQSNELMLEFTKVKFFQDKEMVTAIIIHIG